MYDMFSRMHRPENDTYKCPDCDVIIPRKDFRTHPEVCVQTQRIINQKPVEFGGNIVINNDTNGLLHDSKSSSDTPEPGQTNYSGPYHCTSCDKVFTTVAGRWRHKRKVHEGVRYKCELCDHKATQSNSLKKHEQAKHGIITAGNYHCKSCDKIFRSDTGRWQHTRSVHDGFRYRCDQCAYTTTNSSSLKIHQNVEHEGIRFTCNMCAYKAKKKDNLKRHKIYKHAFNAPSK